MQAANHPPINLISEKVAFQGVTRFDDRYRLPLGISVNMAAFSATLMAEVSFQPKILLPYLHLGLENEMAIQDVRSPSKLTWLISDCMHSGHVRQLESLHMAWDSCVTAVDTALPV